MNKKASLYMPLKIVYVCSIIIKLDLISWWGHMLSTTKWTLDSDMDKDRQTHKKMLKSTLYKLMSSNGIAGKSIRFFFLLKGWKKRCASAKEQVTVLGYSSTNYPYLIF